MESYKVLRLAFKPVECKNVATELHLSLSLIYQWSRGKDGKSEVRNPLDLMAQLVALVGEELLDWLCRQAGGEFVRAGELPERARRQWEEFKAEMELILRAGQTKLKMENGSGKKGAGDKNHLPSALAQVPGARECGGSRCRHRLPGGRCGYRPAHPH